MPYICGVYAKEQNTYQCSSQSEGTKKFSHNKSEKENGEYEHEIWIKIGTEFPTNSYRMLFSTFTNNRITFNYLHNRIPPRAIIIFFEIMSKPASE